MFLWIGGVRIFFFAEREIERQTDKHTERKTDREKTDIQTDRQRQLHFNQF